MIDRRENIFKRGLVLWLFTLISTVNCFAQHTLIKSNRGEYHIDSAVTVDSSIIKEYLPYKQKLDAQMNEVIGHCAQELTKSYELPETLLGNFFSDAVLAEGRKIDPQIDFAMPSTKGGLRNTLPKGDIHLSDVFELMPFENETVVLKLKGADVELLLAAIAHSGGQPVAGIRIKIDNEKPADVLINGQSFDPSRTYYVLTSDYVANGGDHINGLQNPLEKKVLGLKIRDALIMYIKENTVQHKIIDANLDGRITKN